MQVFRDRRDAGKRLAQALVAYQDRPDVLVLALPRGGVPVGYEIASFLRAPLDVLVVRKLGVPGHSELAMGAIASGGMQVIDHDTVRYANVSSEALEMVIEEEREELARRERVFHDDHPPADARGKQVILVDDGLATGSTMLAAISALRTRSPHAIVCAVPVAPPDTCASIGEHVDDMICLLQPEDLFAVGLWYADFEQTTDDEVRDLLAVNARELRAQSARQGHSHEVYR